MRHKVRVEDPHPHSLAARVLLTNRLQKQERNQWVSFRVDFLTRAFERDGKLRCHYCHREDLVMEVSDDASKAQMRILATLDHVIPRSKGGAEMDEKNIVIACYPCNQRKGDEVLGK